MGGGPCPSGPDGRSGSEPLEACRELAGRECRSIAPARKVRRPPRCAEPVRLPTSPPNAPPPTGALRLMLHVSITLLTPRRKGGTLPCHSPSPNLRNSRFSPPHSHSSPHPSSSSVPLLPILPLGSTFGASLAENITPRYSPDPPRSPALPLPPAVLACRAAARPPASPYRSR